MCCRFLLRLCTQSTILSSRRQDRWTTVVKYGDTIYVTGAPPFEPNTGEIFGGDIKRQARLVLEQMKVCVEAGGSSLDKVLKCNVYATSNEYFTAINEVYLEFFPKDWPARMFVVVGPWAGRFDVEVDCIAGI